MNMIEDISGKGIVERKSSVPGTAEKEEDVDMSDLDEVAFKAKDG